MNKSVVTVVIVALIVLVGGGLFLANRKDSSGAKTTSTDMSNMHTNSNTSNTSNDSSQATATNSVTIENFAFSPANITVKKGTTVTWTNKDSITHDITETDGKNGPNSGNLAPGKTYVFTFDNPGTYKYDCSIHPSMIGSVTVTE